MRGVHIYGCLYGCLVSEICSRGRLSDLVLAAAEIGKMTVLGILFQDFPPASENTEGGISVTAIVGESHIALHSWGEYKYMTIDIFTCGGTADPNAAFEYIVGEISHSDKKKHVINRSM